MPLQWVSLLTTLSKAEKPQCSRRRTLGFSDKNQLKHVLLLQKDVVRPFGSTIFTNFALQFLRKCQKKRNH